jgi:nicotinate-nucleotide pyrophosphorylase
MDREQTLQCVRYITENWPLCFIASSGGLYLKNIQDYKGSGIHAISVGALTHQAVSKSITLEFEK